MHLKYNTVALHPTPVSRLFSLRLFALTPFANLREFFIFVFSFSVSGPLAGLFSLI
jgi:hypothetical protein